VPPDWWCDPKTADSEAGCGVASASIPTGDEAGEWVAAFDAQTGQLDKANRNTRDAVGIVARCERRDRQTVEQLNRPWWRFW
jgi:hypothetical protein